MRVRVVMREGRRRRRSEYKEEAHEWSQRWI